MKSIEKSVLIWFSAREMFDLVADVPRYPEFLPWCEVAATLATHDDGITARIGLNLKGVRQSFTTRNTHSLPSDDLDRDTGAAQPPLGLALDLVDGPFSMLSGQWIFQPVGEPSMRACRVNLSLKYAFSNAALATLIGPVFDRIASSLVDAFVSRAEATYGAFE